LLIAPIYIVTLYVLSEYFDVEDAHSDEFYQKSFLCRLTFMVPVFVIFRMRVYTAWTLSEACCMASGLGAYPTAVEPKLGKGPSNVAEWTKVKQRKEKDYGTEDGWNFDTIHNLNAYGCEFAPTFRSAMRCWNRTVQYWLATYVYHRSPKAWRTTLTMMVSAYWHGIHLGYYLSFMTVPLCLLAEDLMFSIFRPKRSKTEEDEENWAIFDHFWWFFRMRGFEVMAMGFLLLRFDSTLRYWGSTYFLCHILLIVFILFASCYKLLFKRKRSKEE